MVVLRTLVACLLFLVHAANCQKVAVIGQGISGSFTAKYLSDYDLDCKLDSLDIFEAIPIHGPVSPADSAGGDPGWQGSRVTSLKLNNGINIELGASIAHADFHHVLEMIRNDPTIEIGPPFTTGLENEDLERSMGIYIGDHQWALRTWSGWKMLNKFMLILRYNFDLITISRLLKQSVASFEKLPDLLRSTDVGTFFENPDQIWDRLGFLPAVHSSFAVLLDTAGIPAELPPWRSALPFQGSLRKELLTAINLVNYNQNIDEINGLVGLGSFAAASGELFSIKGGNHAVIRSAVRQARNIRSHRGCFGQIHQVPKTVTHVVGSIAGLELFSDEESLGIYDAVVMAAPLHQARIHFMVQSTFDEAVLQPMPLGGLIDTETDPSPDHEGHDPLPGSLPDAAMRPYTQVVTTVVSGAEIQKKMFGFKDAENPPKSIVFTESGKRSLHNITAITRIDPSGVFKIFSNDKLSDTVKASLFGAGVKTEYVKVWGGDHGGATPAYKGQGESTDFLLYDASVGLQGHTTSGALYYPLAMELSSLACMEISAVGAKAVAKLVARRFGWIEARQVSTEHDEL